MLRLAMTCAIAACAAPVARAPATPSPDPQAWTTLQRELAGRWIATTGDAQVPVEFKMMANRTVVLELFGAHGGKTVTTYHQDGTGVVATHYCAQGNQPRLRLRGGDGDKLVFALADATGQDAASPCSSSSRSSRSRRAGSSGSRCIARPTGSSPHDSGATRPPLIG